MLLLTEFHITKIRDIVIPALSSLIVLPEKSNTLSDMVCCVLTVYSYYFSYFELSYGYIIAEMIRQL